MTGLRRSLRRLKLRAANLRALWDMWVQRHRNLPVLRAHFEARLGYELNLETPRKFNEKIQWRKLYDRNPLFATLLDKVRMPDWARGQLPQAYHRFLPDYLHIVRSVDDLDIAALPDDVILKTNHSSGWNILLRKGEPRDVQAIEDQLDDWMARSYGTTQRQMESAYVPIRRRIGVQKLLLWPDGRLADDIRIHMFGDTFGVASIGTVTGDTRLVTYLDENWSPLPIRSGKTPHEPTPPCPKDWPAALDIARLLGAKLDYVRVDFLSAGDRIMLNELTLFHMGGFSSFTPASFEAEMGALWTLPERYGPVSRMLRGLP